MKAGHSQILADVLANDLMNPNTIPFKKGILGKDLVLQLLSGLYSGWPVVDEYDEVIGIVTEVNILRALIQRQDLTQMKVEDIMKVPAATVNEDDPLRVVFETMMKENLLRMPVVRDRRFTGLITRLDLLHHTIARETSKVRSLPVCYWCERAPVDGALDSRTEAWCELQYVLFKHGLSFEDVRLAPTYCPQCSRLVDFIRANRDTSRLPMTASEPWKKRILVVDDEGSIRLLLEEVLKVWGFDVVTAPDGREGLNVLEHTPVDGILLDLDMPVMDGHTMLDEIRWRGYHMPVIVMSGGPDEQGLRNLLYEGAQEFLLKPFDFPHLEYTCKRTFSKVSCQVSENFTSFVA